MQGIFDFSSSMEMDGDYATAPGMYDALFHQFSAGPAADLYSSILPDNTQSFADPLPHNVATAPFKLVDEQSFDPQFQGAVDLSTMGGQTVTDEVVWADLLKDVGMNSV